MEGATARSIDLAEFIPAHRVHSLEAQLEEITRNLKSARARNAALLKAVNGITPADTLMVRRLCDNFNSIITMAQKIEREGRVPVVRFARTDGMITGVELAVIRSEPAPADPRLIEMAVAE